MVAQIQLINYNAAYDPDRCDGLSAWLHTYIFEHHDSLTGRHESTEADDVPSRTQDLSHRGHSLASVTLQRVTLYPRPSLYPNTEPTQSKSHYSVEPLDR